MKKPLLLISSHIFAVALGFGAGVYFLPIITAPPAPDPVAVQTAADGAQFSGQFRRDLEDSDALHWGDGTVHVGKKEITLDGRIAPGPDYKLYLSAQFVETEADFERLKGTMVRVGDVKTFKNFIIPVPDSVDPALFNTVIVWCESFGQFITAARYQ